MNQTIALTLSFQEIFTVIHALVVFKEKEDRKDLADLLARLEYAISGRIRNSQFSEQELCSVADALRFALAESRKHKAERYGYLDLIELENILEEVSKKPVF